MIFRATRILHLLYRRRFHPPEGGTLAVPGHFVQPP